MRNMWRVLAASVVVLSACSSGSDSSPPAASVPASDVVSATDFAVPAPADDPSMARAIEVIGLPPAERDAALATAGLDDEVSFAQASGLETSLGGAEATRAALAEAWGSIVSDAAAIDGASLVAGFRSPPPPPSDAGGLMAGVLVVRGAPGVVLATNDATPGPPITTKKETGAETTVSAGVDSISLEYKVVDPDHKASAEVNVASTIQICPDENGTFTANAAVNYIVTYEGTVQTGALNVTVTGHVGDDAEVTSSDVAFQMKWAGVNGGKPVSANLTVAYDDFGSPNAAVTKATAERTDGLVTDEQIENARSTGLMYAAMFNEQLVDTARIGWQAGRCVTLNASATPGPAGLEPGSLSTITVAPTSKVDSKPTGGTVTATLTSGAAAVAPADTATPADATFEYTAPGEVGQGGIVSFEARSKRGVATGEIEFDTGDSAGNSAGYIASGESLGVTFSGRVASLGEPFTIDMAFPGATGTFAFDAASPTGGNVEVAASGSGAILTGSGTYIVTDNADGTVTVTATVSSCVDVSGACRNDGVHPILLTPV